jgi:hypothetical protein
LEDTGTISSRTWEQIVRAGLGVIEQVLEEIDSADACVFDATDPNLNVLFEIGYAFARNRRLWLLRDSTDEAAKRRWDQLAILAGVKYQSYVNSEDIERHYRRELPHVAPSTLYEQLVEPLLQPSSTPSLLYRPHIHPLNASRELTERLRGERRRGIRLVTDDPSETTVQTLAWYGQEAWAADAVIVHLSSERRVGSAVHNARCAFVAGLGSGFDKAVLMLAEPEIAPGIDYRELIGKCASPRECVEVVDKWLSSHMLDAYERASALQGVSARVRLATDLRTLRLGEHVAENEQELLSQYFVETASYREVISPKNTVLVGRKGAGKTATLIQAAESLREDVRNLVCVVKPLTYEWEGLLKVLKDHRNRGTKGYLLEALWRFLLYSEIARRAREEFMAKPGGHEWGSPQWKLVEFLDHRGALFTEDFAIRLERALVSLAGLQHEPSIEEGQAEIADRLYGGLLKELKGFLLPVLRERERVILLVDNLDKAWTASRDIDELSSFLLALIGAGSRLTDDFARQANRRWSVTMSVALFVRADIFSQLEAREPDKIPATRLDWRNPDMLLRVVEERFVAAKGGNAEGSSLWTDYFCPTVDGTPTREWILSRILPRPRDLVLLCNAAIAAAVNAGQGSVRQDDLRAAEGEYSRFAFEAVQVENGISLSALEAVLYEFIGEHASLDESFVLTILARAGIDLSDQALVIGHLRNLWFLGVQLPDGSTSFSDDAAEQSRDDRLARKGGEEGRLRYVVHPAFRHFLGIRDRAVQAQG